MLFEDDVTVTFSMNAFNKGGRNIHIMGTKGEVHANTEDDTPITVYKFESKEAYQIPMNGADGIKGGHGGGDLGIVSALYEYLTGIYAGKSISTITDSCNNHLIVFAAEEARKKQTIVDMDDYIRSIQ